MSINAEVQRIRDVFSAAADIRVPPFQRSFAWGDEETEILIKDLLEAFRNSVIYFLGAIVVIRPKGRGPADVVDGQQRLTTLTIILAVMRDLTDSTDEQALLHSLIGYSDSPTGAQLAAYLLTIAVIIMLMRMVGRRRAAGTGSLAKT